MSAAREPTFEDIRREHRKRGDAIEDRAELIEVLRDELLAEANICEYYRRDMELARLWRKRANSEEYRGILADKRLAERALTRAAADGGPFGLTLQQAARREAERVRASQAFARAIPAIVNSMVRGGR